MLYYQNESEEFHMSILSTILITSTAAGVICGGNAQANININSLQPQFNNSKKIVIQQGDLNNSNAIKAILKKNGVSIKYLENCLPGVGNPGTGNPGNSKPDTGKPETGKPETDKPGNGDITNSSYATQVVNLVNAERANLRLKPLSIDKNAATAAELRAREIKKSFSHTRPDGSAFSTVLKENGVSYRTSGENIASGQRTPEEVVKSWMNSKGHRENILSDKYTSIGVGYYENGGTAYWVQLFIG